MLQNKSNRQPQPTPNKLQSLQCLPYDTKLKMSLEIDETPWHLKTATETRPWDGSRKTSIEHHRTTPKACRRYDPASPLLESVDGDNEPTILHTKHNEEDYLDNLNHIWHTH